MTLEDIRQLLDQHYEIMKTQTETLRSLDEITASHERRIRELEQELYFLRGGRNLQG